MELDFVKVGLYILVFIPGYIFVQTRDYHLLREKKPQFEKTLEIILFSVIIWVISLASPVWAIGQAARVRLLSLIADQLNQQTGLPAAFPDIPSIVIRNSALSIVFFSSLCLWTFVFANLWGIVRKLRIVDGGLKWLTGRDWYPTVMYRFTNENINKAVEVTVDRNRYMGILYSAPDTKDDNYIIISDPYRIVKRRRSYVLEKLELVDHIVIKYSDIREIRSYDSSLIVPLQGG